MGRSDEFTSIDRAADPRRYVRDLDAMSGRPIARTYKARSYELLGDLAGAVVLDVGCGAAAPACPTHMSRARRARAGRSS